MEESIDYDGQIDVEPRFTKAEIERVNAFPWMTPVADHPETPCGWVASAGGRKLTSRDGPESADAAAWLRLIVRSFARRGFPRFHGMVTGRRRLARELFIIEVRDDVVIETEF